jgi:HD superfamily phosphodiesterase
MALNLSNLFKFVLATSIKYNIDESHSLGHSMRVFQFAEQIAAEETLYKSNPAIFMAHRPIIQAAAILHDTCDKKYRDEAEGLLDIGEFLQPMMSVKDISTTVDIIKHMSYSKVIKYGMPNFGEYQTAFNVVREADLLDAYDFDRAMIYHINCLEETTEVAFDNSRELFETRVWRHMDDRLLLTNHAINMHPEFTCKSIARMNQWKRVLPK